MTIYRCNHLKANGVPCQSPALRGHAYCYYHHNSELRENRRIKQGGPDAFSVDISSLEDGDSIQSAILSITSAIIDRNIDRTTAQTLLYALQLAMSNLKNTHPTPGPREQSVVKIHFEDDEDFDAIDESAEADEDDELDDEEVEDVVVASSVAVAAAINPVPPKAADPSGRKSPASATLDQPERPAGSTPSKRTFNLSNFS